jgi:hypothetical protein
MLSSCCEDVNLTTLVFRISTIFFRGIDVKAFQPQMENFNSSFSARRRSNSIAASEVDFII